VGGGNEGSGWGLQRIRVEKNCQEKQVIKKEKAGTREKREPIAATGKSLGGGGVLGVG